MPTDPTHADAATTLRRAAERMRATLIPLANLANLVTYQSRHLDLLRRDVSESADALDALATRSSLAMTETERSTLELVLAVVKDMHESHRTILREVIDRCALRSDAARAADAAPPRETTEREALGRVIGRNLDLDPAAHPDSMVEDLGSCPGCLSVADAILAEFDVRRRAPSPETTEPHS